MLICNTYPFSLSEIKSFLFLLFYFIFFLKAASAAHGSSWAGDQTRTSAVTQATTVRFLTHCTLAGPPQIMSLIWKKLPFGTFALLSSAIWPKIYYKRSILQYFLASYWRKIKTQVSLCFSKVCFILLHFYERPILAPVFSDRKKYWENFHL